MNVRNALSARNNPGIVTRLLQEEIDKGFIRGPFSKSPFKQHRVSPLGLATHKYSKKQRLITSHLVLALGCLLPSLLPFDSACLLFCTCLVPEH
jgi:hypothetical protein